MKLVSRKNVSKRIRSLRGSRSQDQVEKVWRIDRVYISRYEHGAIPDPENLVKIARAEKVSVDWLLTGQDYSAGSGEKANPVPEKSAEPIAGNQ